MKRSSFAVLMFASLVACGSKSSSTTSSSSSSSTSSSSSSTSSSTSGMGGAGGGGSACVKPGDAGNSKGVGKYCTAGGNQCAGSSYATVCLADLGQKENFCTHLSCANNAECGEKAHCHKEMAGSACVPDACEPPGTGGGGGGGMGGSGAGGKGGAGGH